eukprot:12185067-Alexandrium_andersonii.AAC.1
MEKMLAVSEHDWLVLKSGGRLLGCERLPLPGLVAARAGLHLLPGRARGHRVLCPVLPLLRGLRGQGPRRAAPGRRRRPPRAPWPFLAVGRIGPAALHSPSRGGCG